MKFHKLHPFLSHKKFLFCKIPTSEIFSQQHYATVLLGCIVLMMMPKVSRSQSILNSDWPIRVLANAQELTDCEGLGFPNATKNECGYCTGGTTGVPSNYGRDCNGNCGGKEVIDCANVCGGSAYIDECSGECKGGTTNIEDGSIPNPHRDCRGYCLTSGGQYFVDTCGVCNGGSSPFEDCTNKCHLPGQEDLMAKLICGERCVGGSSEVPISEVLDGCGNCKSEERECVCNGTGQRDPCGVCNGGGKTCMRILNFTPQAVPNMTEFILLIEGAFKGRQQYLRCLITSTIDEGIGLQLEFVGTTNGTHLKCRVRLSAGTYKVGAGIITGDSPEVDTIENPELLVYDNANYVDMVPSSVSFDRDQDPSNQLMLTFTRGKVPPRPLTCIISGPGWPPELRLAPGKANSHDTCILPYANTSLKVKVAPSLNGIHPFTNTFSFTFYSSPPEIKKYYIAEDGHAVIIVFDRPVNICNLETCPDLLNNDTITRLGGNATCQWATKQQLVITVQRKITGDPIRITFKRGILMQDDQQYASRKIDGLTIDAWYPRPSSSAQLAISGPSALPFCGNFTLVAHFSSPKGDAGFYWTAIRKDRKLERQIADALLVCRTASLTLDIGLLQVGINYTFILTAQHPDKKKYEARHVVQRKNYIGALVTAYSDVMNQPSISVSQTITLQADISLPECYTDIESVQRLWSVNNALVKFDFDSRKSEIYKILPYSLPDSTEITFYAMAYFVNLQNVTSSKVTLNVAPLIPKAAIKGSSKRIVGNKDGFLILESADDNGGIPLVYQWRCYDKNHDICYNYARDAKSALLIDREKRKLPVLTIPLESLKAGQVLTFELQVFNANNRYQTGSAASAIVIVENGSIPQVVIQSVISDGIEPFERNPTIGAYSIPAQLPIMIHATINVTNKMRLESVQWDIKGVSAPFAYSTLNKDTYLFLEEGFLIDHGLYLIGLSACTSENVCGVANLTIHAVPGTTLCQLNVAPYIQYESVKSQVLGCSIPNGRQPLTYQLFVSINESMNAISPPQISTTFEFFGPPVPQGSISQFHVQVCDKYSLCKLFPGNIVKSFESEVKFDDRMKLFDKANLCLTTNNPVSALALFLTAAMDSTTSLETNEADAMITSAKKAVVNRYVNSGLLGLVYSAMLPLLKRGEKDIKLDALAAMRRATRQAYSYDVKPPSSVLTLGHANSIEALQGNADDEVKQKVRLTLSTIVQFMSRDMQLGSRKLLLGVLPDQPNTLVFRQLLSSAPITVTGKDTTGKLIEGKVAFQPEIRERFRQWACSSEQNCNGAVVSLTLYPAANSPYPTTEPLVSPIFDVSLRNPQTGEIMSESFGDDSNAVRLALTNFGNTTRAREEGLVHKCMYWDDDAKIWTMYGVKTMGEEGNAMTCWASHLSSFAVFEMKEELSHENEQSALRSRGLSTSSVVGIVVAVLVGVFIIGLVMFFVVRKKQAKSARVSTEALQPKHIEKLRGMERTIAHVKQFAT